MKLYPHPDYRQADFLLGREYALPDEERAKQVKKLRAFTPPEQLELTNTTVKGREGHDIPIRIYRKKGASEPAPIIMNIHGGAHIRGDLDQDDAKCCYYAEHVPAIVVSVQYRLAPQYTFPAPLNDCLDVWYWIYENAASFGGDPERMGLYGSSAGGTLCGGLAFYIRDHGGPQIRLNAMMYPSLDLQKNLSDIQMQTRQTHPEKEPSALFLGGFNGTLPSYYAYANLSVDFVGLPPALVVMAEYDGLRDSGRNYVDKMLHDGVRCESYILPRMGHGFDMVRDAPLTQWIYQGVCLSFRREFEMGATGQ